MNKESAELRLARFQSRLDSLSSLFHGMNSEFCFYFGSLDSSSREKGFEHLRVFVDQVCRYRIQRWEKDSADELVAAIESLAEIDNESEARLRKLTERLTEMDALDYSMGENEVGFETWRQVSDSFMELMICEKKFLYQASQHIAIPANTVANAESTGNKLAK